MTENLRVNEVTYFNFILSYEGELDIYNKFEKYRKT